MWMLLLACAPHVGDLYGGGSLHLEVASGAWDYEGVRESDLLFADASAIPDNGVLAYEALDGAWVVRANDLFGTEIADALGIDCDNGVTEMSLAVLPGTVFLSLRAGMFDAAEQLYLQGHADPTGDVLAGEASTEAGSTLPASCRQGDPTPATIHVQWALDAGVHVVDHECTDCGSTLFDIHL